jgi:hypothetical protein
MYFTAPQSTGPPQSSAPQPDVGVKSATQQPQLCYGQPPPLAQHQHLYFVVQPPQQPQSVFAAPTQPQVPHFVTAQQPQPFLLQQGQQPVPPQQQQPPAAWTQHPSKKLVYVPVLIDDEPNHAPSQPVVTNHFSPAMQPPFQYQSPMVQQFAPMPQFEGLPQSQNGSHMQSGQSVAAGGVGARDDRVLEPVQKTKVKPPVQSVQKAEPNVKLNFSQLCRHFVYGSCNRKLCRFRHPAGEELERLKKLSPGELEDANAGPVQAITDGGKPCGSVPPPTPSENGVSDCASWMDSRESDQGIQNILRDLK